jgi:purine-binding chemotaxis protein CheW
MSKSLAASKQLMQTYLSELLTEEEVAQKTLSVKEKEIKPLEKLLASATFPQIFEQENTEALSSTKAEQKSFYQENRAEQAKNIIKPSQANIEPKVALRKSVESSSKIALNDIKTRKSLGGFEAIDQRSYRQGDFQAMFFEVAGLMIAVPLIELGGILNNDKITSLMGKPDWFKGVMLHREDKISVVDTARWVMPEKCDEALISALNYQYIIMLSDSSWGLTAESLTDTVTLKQEDVKWLDTPNKRPWLAGLVKNRMCALLDVKSLIKLLEKGVNITQE